MLFRSRTAAAEPQPQGGSGRRPEAGEGTDMKTAPAAPRNIDEYIAAFPPDVRKILQKIRATIRKAAPEAEEKISYRMPTFALNGNLVHFAAFTAHIGFYPTPT